MAEIGEQRKRIREGQMEMRESAQEIVCEYDQLRKETLLLSKQAARYQRSLNEMFKIVIARENSDLSEADGLIHSLNEMFKIVIARENSNLSEADGLIQCLREEGKHEE
ncbi:hypothetical protein OIU74_014782 [Salix koriyanagi]|uniref:Uncharacterized protein n=1 Tax=Salix koriyanagi TaxID=2511006 RepID=A0A9Q0PX92_9ROSI|nr:hypothetical protein OIU74_014782 [Salix koriyanagi]